MTDKMKVYDVWYVIDEKICYKRYVRAVSKEDAEEQATELLTMKITEAK